MKLFEVQRRKNKNISRNNFYSLYSIFFSIFPPLENRPCRNEIMKLGVPAQYAHFYMVASQLSRFNAFYSLYNIHGSIVMSRKYLIFQKTETRSKVRVLPSRRWRSGGRKKIIEIQYTVSKRPRWTSFLGLGDGSMTLIVGVLHKTAYLAVDLFLSSVTRLEVIPSIVRSNNTLYYNYRW